MPVFETDILRREGDAAGYDEARFSHSEKCEPGDGMRSRIMCVDDVCAPFLGNRAQLAGGADVPFATQSQTICWKARALRPLDERRTGRRHDERAKAEISQSRGKEKNLALSASPAPPGIDVKDSGQVHYVSSFRANVRSLESEEQLVGGVSRARGGCTGPQ